LIKQTKDLEPQIESKDTPVKTPDNTSLETRSKTLTKKPIEEPQPRTASLTTPSNTTSSLKTSNKPLEVKENSVILSSGIQNFSLV
jgi:hypothetical protein